MVMEGLVGIVALVAVCALHPADYYAINLSPEKFAATGLSTVHLPALAAAVGENVAGRPGGAVSLAIGFTQIFAGLPLLRGLMSYWYHFAIMFEALFILTTIDTGTRVGRFLVQEFAGHLIPKFERTDWLPGTIVSTLLVVGGWSYFILTGSISQIWPMFGIANQLLAAIALCVATTVILKEGRGRYAAATLVPLAFVSITTIDAGVLSIRDNFLPMTRVPGTEFAGWLDAALTAVLIACVLLILFASIRAWVAGPKAALVAAAEGPAAGPPPPDGCC
jgi:carbon starvation protein